VLTLVRRRPSGLLRLRVPLVLALAAGVPGLFGPSMLAASAQSVDVQVGITNQAPTISSLSPPAIPENVHTAVEIGGTGFSGPTHTIVSVTFGGSPAYSFSVNSPADIGAQTPYLPPGVYRVVVTTTFGATNTASNGADFLTVVATPPRGGSGAPARPPLRAATANPTSPPSTGDLPVTAASPPSTEASAAPTADPESSQGRSAVMSPDPPQAPGGSGAAGGGTVKGTSAGSGFFGLNQVADALFGFYGRHLMLSLFFTAALLCAFMAIAFTLVATRRRKKREALPRIRF
jgi:hypothetical protein